MQYLSTPKSYMFASFHVFTVCDTIVGYATIVRIGLHVYHMLRIERAQIDERSNDLQR